jgi:hypothetical protein
MRKSRAIRKSLIYLNHVADEDFCGHQRRTDILLKAKGAWLRRRK